VLRPRRDPRGQALVELALVLPLFLMVLIGIVVLGIGVFYQQQIANGAREAARYASVHSATAQCPTVSNLAPDNSLLPAPNSYFACDTPANGWPLMRAQMTGNLFGMSVDRIRMTACWSGYWTKDSGGNWGTYDQIAIDPATHARNSFRECTVPVYGWCPGAAGASTIHTINPRTGEDPGCSVSPGDRPVVRLDCSKDFPKTDSTNDTASNFAGSGDVNSNQVTVLACYGWRPPLAGFLLIPDEVSLSAVVNQAMEYQQ
jgi:hypothetical protein